MVAPRFTKFLSIALLVTLLTSSVHSADDDSCPSEAKVQSYKNEKTTRYIVVIKKDDASVKTEQSAAEMHYQHMKKCWNKTVKRRSGSGILSKEDADNPNVLRDFSIAGLIEGYSAKFSAKFVDEQLKKMKGVKYVEEDQPVKKNFAVPQHLYKRAVDNNPQKNDDRIDQAKRPLDGKFTFPDSAGQGVNIFIVDTGIRTTHSEFGKRAKSGGAFCEGCNEDDENGHGTHVASIAAGKTLGVARKANLIAIRVLDASGSGSNAGVIDGMTAVIEQHQKSPGKKSVVNMSLGGSFSQAVNDAVDALTEAGVHVVVAGGNESADACTKSPASALKAITVGATQENDETIANFSNFGKCTDIFAPGSNIRGADFSNDNGQVVFSGTSQACPHVAGTVALIIAKSGNKSPAAMQTELIKLSTKGVVKGIKSDTPNNFLRVPAA